MLAPVLPRLRRALARRMWVGECEVCRAWCEGSLCAACIALFARPVHRCSGCAIRLSAEQVLCGRCLIDGPLFDGCVCVADYNYPWDGLIAELKFHGRPELSAGMAALMASAVKARGGTMPDMLTPIPLTPQRLCERGYNQAWELARRVAPSLACQASGQLLERILDRPHQADLTRAQREANLRGVFMVNPALQTSVRGRHLALVDDVLTTGSTAREAAAVLRRAGARRVDLFTLARTPEPGAH